MDFYIVAKDADDVDALKKAHAAITTGGWYKARIGYTSGSAGDCYGRNASWLLTQRIDKLEGRVFLRATSRYDLEALVHAYKALEAGATRITVTFQDGSPAVVFQPLDITKLRQKVMYSI